MIVTSSSEQDYDFPKLYRDEVARNKLKLVLINETLNITLDEYFALFIDDNAPHSYSRYALIAFSNSHSLSQSLIILHYIFVAIYQTKTSPIKSYHESNKNVDISCTPWSEINSTLGYAREIKLIKPLNIPGLPSTRCTSVQRYQRFGKSSIVSIHICECTVLYVRTCTYNRKSLYIAMLMTRSVNNEILCVYTCLSIHVSVITNELGDFGMILCSSTRMEDVPASSTFSVEDLLVVRHRSIIISSCYC